MSNFDAKTNQVLANSKEQLNVLLSNIVSFDDSDMELYDACYRDVFGSEPPAFSYMSSTFYAQFAAEILLGLLSSNPLRRVILAQIDDEKKRKGRGPYWDPSMEDKRFGIEGRDYTEDMKDLMDMMHTSYAKIATLNSWYGTDEGRKEFDMYCLSPKSINNIKRIAIEFPYLIRRFDHDEIFAKEIMEYAGIVAVQIKEAAEEAGFDIGN